jgi:hypothetical protein
MSGEPWAPLTVRHARIVTAAAAGGINVRGVECAFMVCDVSGFVPAIAVPTVRGLRELVPCLDAVSIDLECTDAERPVLRALVDSLWRSCR